MWGYGREAMEPFLHELCWVTGANTLALWLEEFHSQRNPRSDAASPKWRERPS